jgi:hypothetical protein
LPIRPLGTDGHHSVGRLGSGQSPLIAPSAPTSMTTVTSLTVAEIG